MARRLCAEGEYPDGLLAVAGHRLHEARHAAPDQPLVDGAWAALLAGAGAHRITGLLDAAIRDGAFPATPEQAAAAAHDHRSRQLRVLALEQRLVGVVGLLAGHGLGARVLKGPAVAHLDYPDPGLRSYIDLDVLVRAADIDSVVHVLTDAGFARTLAEPRPGFDRRFDKGLTMVPRDGFELDLHRTFVLGPWGRLVDLDALWEASEDLCLGGVAVQALTRPHRFLHACYHAALGDWPLRLGSLRDIAEMLRAVDGDPAAAASVRAVAESWGVEAVMAAAVADTHRLLGGPAGALTEWAQDHVPGRRAEAWLALHTRTDKTFAAQAVATVGVLPGWRDRAAYLYALLLPDSRYTVGRHRSPLARISYAIAQVRKGRRPDSPTRPSGDPTRT